MYYKKHCNTAFIIFNVSGTIIQYAMAMNWITYTQWKYNSTVIKPQKQKTYTFPFESLCLFILPCVLRTLNCITTLKNIWTKKYNKNITGQTCLPKLNYWQNVSLFLNCKIFSVTVKAD